RLALAEAVGRAGRVAVVREVLTIVLATAQRLRRLASVGQMAWSSALREAVGLGVKVGEWLARRLALAEAVGRAGQAAVVRGALTIVLAAAQRVQYSEWAVPKESPSALGEGFGLAGASTGSAVDPELMGMDFEVW